MPNQIVKKDTSESKLIHDLGLDELSDEGFLRLMEHRKPNRELPESKNRPFVKV